jgi:hypothetical protein
VLFGVESRPWMLQSRISAARRDAHFELTGDCRDNPHRRTDEGLLHDGGIRHVRLPSDSKKRYDGDGKDGKICRLIVYQ